jgi:hypothetical protein
VERELVQKRRRDMRRIFRRLALWGGAAAVVAGGFAFMDSNAVGNASLGAGTDSATGYTVTTISWHSAELTTSFFVTGVSLELTSKATTAPANGIPTTVNVALVLSTADHVIVSTGTHGLCQFGATGQEWTVETGHGTGKLTCSIDVKASGEPPATDIEGLAVEASN